uniref:Tetratricopeptide repeat domain 33 n=1 Tax=Equus asinus TaxID=9793 RepID=A0A8C4M1A1_EQUAS
MGVLADFGTSSAWIRRDSLGPLLLCRRLAVHRCVDFSCFYWPFTAIRSFQVALHIYPMNPEIWKEDLSWARTLQEQQKVAQRIKKSEAPVEVTHFSLKSVPDYDFESDEIVAVCAAIAEKQKTISANKTMVIVSASGTVETVTEKEDGAAPPDGSVFIKAR